jgi:hypothetical protein
MFLASDWLGDITVASRAAAGRDRSERDPAPCVEPAAMRAGNGAVTACCFDLGS